MTKEVLACWNEAVRLFKSGVTPYSDDYFRLMYLVYLCKTGGLSSPREVSMGG